MTLLDAYALVALVLDEPAAAEVETLLRAGGTRIVIANLAEAIDVTQRVYAKPPDRVRSAIEPLLVAGIVSPVLSDVPAAWRAADLRLAHYHRSACPLSSADCLLLAQAIDDDDGIATADPPLAKTARAEGVAVAALPDARGRRP